MRAVPTDRTEHRRLERRALLATAGFVLIAGVLVVDAIGRYRLPDGLGRRLGIVPFLLLAVVVVVAWVVLRRMYRAAAAARPVTLPADPTPGQVYGIPELDDPPRRNRALAGEEEPPQRW